VYEVTVPEGAVHVRTIVVVVAVPEVNAVGALSNVKILVIAVE